MPTTRASRPWREVTPAEVRTFGLGPAADVRATDVVSHGLAGTEFTLHAPWGSARLRSGTPGRHLVPHALAAAAVAERMGIGSTTSPRRWRPAAAPTTA